MQVLDENGGLFVTEMSMLGIRATNYTISCETLPRVPRMPNSSANMLATMHANTLADSCIPPPAMKSRAQGALGEDVALKIAAICAGVLSKTVF